MVTVNENIKAAAQAAITDSRSYTDTEIGKLDVSSVGGAGKYISAISEADGKISATATNLATSVTESSNVPVTSGAVYTAINSATPNLTAGNGISITDGTGTEKIIAASFGTVSSTNTTKPVTGAAVNSAVSSKQNTLTAGRGTEISNDTITANITAGPGISKTNDTGTAIKLSAVLPTSDPGVDNVLWLEVS